jgi:hypothetical protein
MASQVQSPQPLDELAALAQVLQQQNILPTLLRNFGKQMRTALAGTPNACAPNTNAAASSSPAAASSDTELSVASQLLSESPVPQAASLLCSLGSSEQSAFSALSRGLVDVAFKARSYEGEHESKVQQLTHFQATLQEDIGANEEQRVAYAQSQHSLVQMRTRIEREIEEMKLQVATLLQEQQTATAEEELAHTEMQATFAALQSQQAALCTATDDSERARLAVEAAGQCLSQLRAAIADLELAERDRAAFHSKMQAQLASADAQLDGLHAQIGEAQLAVAVAVQQQVCLRRVLQDTTEEVHEQTCAMHRAQAFVKLLQTQLDQAERLRPQMQAQQASIHQELVSLASEKIQLQLQQSHCVDYETTSSGLLGFPRHTRHHSRALERSALTSRLTHVSARVESLTIQATALAERLQAHSANCETLRTSLEARRKAEADAKLKVEGVIRACAQVQMKLTTAEAAVLSAKLALQQRKHQRDEVATHQRRSFLSHSEAQSELAQCRLQLIDQEHTLEVASTTHAETLLSMQAAHSRRDQADARLHAHRAKWAQQASQAKELSARAVGSTLQLVHLQQRTVECEQRASHLQSSTSLLESHVAQQVASSREVRHRISEQQGEATKQRLLSSLSKDVLNFAAVLNPELAPLAAAAKAAADLPLAQQQPVIDKYDAMTNGR